MEQVTSVDALRESVRALPRPLALVPTMGAIHRGHMALVNRAQAENASTAVSIFVNPAQFGPSEDFTRYPRDLEADLALLREARVDLVFTPSADEMYPPGFDRWVDPGALGTRLEGASRPGHFRGVCTVVLKLFNLFRPDRAYFGEKDGQQLLVVEAMARDLDTGAEIVRVPTVRADDGLALSSRNARLSHDERSAATVLWHALSLARLPIRGRRAGCSVHSPTDGGVHRLGAAGSGPTTSASPTPQRWRSWVTSTGPRWSLSPSGWVPLASSTTSGCPSEAEGCRVTG